MVQTVAEHINAAIAKIGEKLTLRRFEVITKTDNDAFGAYLHMGGRIGVLTVLEGTTDADAAKDVAMHIAALNQNMFLVTKFLLKKLSMSVKY